jgi:transcriptional regulator with XRE-family HTH domain
MVSKLKIARIQAELSQVRLAEIAGTYQGRISRLEHGGRPDPDEAVVLARAVGVPPRELFGDGYSE